MTKKEMMNALVNYITNAPEMNFVVTHATGTDEDVSRDEMLAFLNKEIDQLSKKRAASGKPSKVETERNEFRAKILEWLKSHPGSTATDIQNAFNVSNQRVNGLIRPLVKSNQIIRIEIKGKPYFSVAGFETETAETAE